MCHVIACCCWYFDINIFNLACPTPVVGEVGRGCEVASLIDIRGVFGFNLLKGSSLVGRGRDSDAALDIIGLAKVPLISGFDAEAERCGGLNFFPSNNAGGEEGGGTIPGEEAEADKLGSLNVGFGLIASSGDTLGFLEAPFAHKAATAVTCPPLPPLAERTSYFGPSVGGLSG